MRVRARRTATSTLVVLAAAIGLAATAGPAMAGVRQDRGIEPMAAVSYNVCGTTSNLAAAGTDSKVEVRLRGSQGASPFIQLDNPNRDDFEIGHTDCFPNIVLADLGVLSSLDVRFTRLSGDDNFEWNLSHFTVIATGDPDAVFPCQCWFRATQTRNLRVA